MLLKLAWRNLWRNKRRTLITAAAIFFSITLSILMTSLQQGTWAQLISSVVEQYSGYAQIHKKGYWKEQILENSMPLLTLDSLNKVPENLEDMIPRIESFALGSDVDNAFGTQVMGIDPLREDKLTGLSSKLSSGRYLKPGEEAILVSEGYADIMELGVGDTLVLLGQGYHGITAVGKYPVVGLLHFGNPELNKRLSYLPLRQAQYLYGMEGRVTSMVLKFKNNYRFQKTVEEIRQELDTNRYEILTWKKMNPQLVQAIQTDTGGMMIELFIIYLVIAFGIFSTVIMMTAERKHEFGILLAIGMKRWRMQVMTFYETLFLAFLGIMSGVIFTLPVVMYFKNEPIHLGGDMAAKFAEFGFEPVIAFSAQPYVFLNNVLIVFFIVLLVYLYPYRKLRKLDSIKAMRG